VNRNPYNRLMPSLNGQAGSELLEQQSFARRNGLWVPARDTDLVLADTAINNANTARHGFLKKLSGNSSEFLDGTGAWSSPTAAGSAADIMLMKPFFTEQGFLPATTHREDLYTFPAADFSNLNSSTLSRSMSRAKVTTSASSPANFGWDVGALKTKILFILTGMRCQPGTGTFALFFADSLPSAAELPNGSYQFFIQGNATAQCQLFKRAAGAYTALGSAEPQVIPSYAVTAGNFGVAMYYDDSTGRLIGFVRLGAEAWFPICDTTDSSFTTMRYVGVRLSYSGASQFHWMKTPMGIYYTA